MKLFTELGTAIEAAWRAVDQNEDAFPRIAEEHLRRADLPSKVDPWQILEWSLEQVELPRQKDLYSSFGEPPITLFTSSKFYIDVYFWFEGTTAIHQHGFCGAFQVLHGSSIHSWYDFAVKDKVNFFTEIGEMDLKACELLEKGAIQKILYGRQYIHGLFHLDSPSVTIVVRTDKGPIDPPQFNYLKPTLAVDPFYSDETVTKKIQVISALLKADRPDADELIGRYLGESDFQTTYTLLKYLRPAVRVDAVAEMFSVDRPDRFAKFIEIVHKRHGKRAEVFDAVFAHADKLDEILARRRLLTDPHHRFFFALLLNLENREQVFSLMQKRYPETAPREKVLDLVFDLAQTRVAGDMQNGLGIEPFDDVDLAIFEALLDGTSPDAIGPKLRAEYAPEKFASFEADLAARIQKIHRAAIFGPLFD